MDLDDQRDELKRISAEINDISDGLKNRKKKNRNRKTRAKAMTVKTPAIPIRITEQIPEKTEKRKTAQKKSSLLPITQAIRSQNRPDRHCR